jgi:hypothetical protein
VAADDASQEKEGKTAPAAAEVKDAEMKD